jgi:tRNA(Ile)-lysidine synthase
MTVRLDVGLLPAATPLVVAVSGGCDSMALWDLLAAMRRWPLIVWHLDHGLRPDAGRDAEAIAELAARHTAAGIAPAAVICELADVAALASGWGISIEAAGRRHRYGRLTAIARAHGAGAVVTAHHRDDQAETVLMNLLRGAGPDGWRGIARSRPLAEGVALVRPAVSVPRQVLRTYAVQRAVPWYEDSTNADTAYRRNLIRRRVLPELELACPGFTTALLERAEREACQQVTRQSAVDQLTQVAITSEGLHLAAWPTLDEDLATVLLATWLRRLQIDVDRHRLGRLRDLCHGAPDRRLRLGPWTFTRYRDRIGVHRAE